MSQAKQVKDIYHKVVNDVIEGVREAFIDEGYDESILHELKQAWEARLLQSKALEEVQTQHEFRRETAQTAAPGPSSQQHQSTVNRAPPAHQHHQQPAAVAQHPHGPPQVVHQPMPPMLNLQGQLLTLAPHAAGVPLAAGTEQFSQQLTHFLVPSASGQGQLLMPAGAGQFIQRPSQQQQQIQIGGQTFTIAPPQQ